jgi:hypothetical protein
VCQVQLVCPCDRSSDDNLLEDALHIDMNNDMKEQQASRHSQPAVMEDSKKRAAYSPPVLRFYGSVSKLTSGTATRRNDGANSRRRASDRAAKKNIVRIGTHPLGIGLYLFDYKPEYCGKSEQGRQFGVMADEVESVMPLAVSVHSNGYKLVNYAMLEISHSLD